jgi:hypothetical protein
MMEQVSVIDKKHTVAVTKPAPPVEDKDIGPWSSEAFYLMDWRPPDRDENGKKIAVA